MGKTVEELLEWEKTEHRYNMIQKVLPYFKKYANESDSIPIIVGGDIAHVKAKPSNGYIFSSWSGNTRTGGNQDGNPGVAHLEKYTSIDMRCYDSSNCTFDIIINGHFIKE